MLWHFFGLATILATLCKIWANFPPSSGRPAWDKHFSLLCLGVMEKGIKTFYNKDNRSALKRCYVSTTIHLTFVDHAMATSPKPNISCLD